MHKTAATKAERNPASKPPSETTKPALVWTIHFLTTQRHREFFRKIDHQHFEECSVLKQSTSHEADWTMSISFLTTMALIELR